MDNKKFIQKIIKKDKNNELELILDQKNFDEETKNILLNIAYKIEASYHDYKTVKGRKETKEEFINYFIQNIQNNCDEIQLKKEGIPENKTFLVEKEKKKITCYPIEKKLLYCLAKIGKKEKIISDEYYLVDETLSELINTGNNIETTEVIRDFNGWSWFVSTFEIESIEHNLIYQNLIMLVGRDFLEQWIKDSDSKDYYKMFLNKLKELYGKEAEVKARLTLEKISILLRTQIDNKFLKKLKKQKTEEEKKYKEVEDKDTFISEKDKQKRKLTRKIKKIDKIISDKALLQAEYEKKIEKLESKKNIPSIKTFKDLLAKERSKLLKEIEDCNKQLIPKNFIKLKTDLENRIEVLKISETENANKELESLILDFQLLVLDAYKLKIEKAEEKADVLRLMYELRYYTMLPMKRNEKIFENEVLKPKLEKLYENLIDKAIEKKVIKSIMKTPENNYMIYKPVFNMQIIEMENLEVKLNKLDEKNQIKVQFLDADAFEKEIDISNELLNDLLIKLNKREKLFV